MSVQDGVSLIAAERLRQVNAEGWTPEHDDEHDDGELAQAAACYAKRDTVSDDPAPWDVIGGGATPPSWPWGWASYKPTPDDRIRELVKAGALIAAEIDRLQRAELLR